MEKNDQTKQLENKLQQSAEEIETREFSSVWQDIKGEVTPPKKNKNFFRWMAVAVSFACVLIVSLVFFPTLFNQENEKYFSDQISMVYTTQTDFYQGIQQGNINHVDFTRYKENSFGLYKTNKSKIKGGSVLLMDNADNPTFMLDVKFYDKSISDIQIEKEEFNNFSTTNLLNIYYQLKQGYPLDGIYVYDVRASFNNTKYVMEYTCFTEEIQPFFEEFFK